MKMKRLVGLLGTMEFQMGSIPVQECNDEEFSLLRMVPGFNEANGIRSSIAKTMKTLTKKLKENLSKEKCQEAFGRDEPPVSEMEAVLGFVEIFGFRTEHLEGHLLPFYHQIGFKDSQLSVSFQLQRE